MDFYQEVVVVTRYKEICQSHIIEVMKSLPPETEYLMELLNEVGLLPRFECFQLLNGWRYIDFQTGHFPNFKQFGHFANLEHFTTDSHFSKFMHVTIDQSLLR